MPENKFKFSLQCPLPQLDFDRITLGHGSGGLLTNKLLEELVFKALKRTGKEENHDGAFLQLSGAVAFSSDSFVVSPIFFPGGNIGDLAVNGTVNDLSMCGAIPKYLSLSFIIEEGLPTADFWEILLAIQQACETANVKVVTGDIKVVEKGKGDGIFINTSGIGFIHEHAAISFQNIKVGDRIIVSGNIASHGIAIMSLREGLQFETAIISDTAPLNGLVTELLNTFGKHIHFLRDPTRGGVATVLNEVAIKADLGIEIHEKLLPVAEQVKGACEMLGLDPLYVANEGIFITMVPPHVADAALALMCKHERGINATLIGEVTAEHQQQVILNSTIGGRRVIRMLPGEQLPRIC